jgi:formate dehydrogenase beta subunit
MPILITIDGKEVEALKGEPILKASLKAGIYIPHLCHHPDLAPFDSVAPVDVCYRGEEEVRSDPKGDKYRGCGLCAVEIAPTQSPVLACTTSAEEGMNVVTSSLAVSTLRRENLSLLLENHPHACLTCVQSESCSLTQCFSNVPEEERCCSQTNSCELRKVAEYIGLKEDLPRYRPQELYCEENKPLFVRDYNLCIGCLRCVRVCSDIIGAKALGYAVGSQGIAVGTVKSSIEESGCVFCGACVEVCPTGALRDKNQNAGNCKEALIPCRTACPLGMDVPKYVFYIAHDSLIEAAQTIRDRTPLALSLSYICHHPCESQCRRGELNQPIAICDLKRLALEDKESRLVESPIRKTETGKRVAVVGAGPAGLVASYYLSVLGHAVTVFESQPEAGGMLRWAIPEYRLPRQIVFQDIKNIEAAGVKILTGVTIDKTDFRKDLSLNRWDAVFLATGAQDSKKMDVKGSSFRGVYWGLDFLREAKEGMDFDLGQKILVIGGENVSLDAAMTALRYGPSSVILACLEKREKMPAFDSKIQEAEEEGIEILPGWGVKKIEGNGQEVSGVELMACTSVFDDQGNFCPNYDESLSKFIEADSVILAIGQSPDPSFLPDDFGVRLREDGTIEVSKKTFQTDVPRLFAAGEAAFGPASAVEVLAMGRQAASSIDRYLGGRGLEEPVADTGGLHQGLLWREETDRFLEWDRIKMAELPPSERTHSFALIQIGYSKGEGKEEASRCLRCHLRFLFTPVVLPPEK